MPFLTPQVLLVALSAAISLFVLIGQRRSSIRESIEQLDDRLLSSLNSKVKPLLHDVDFMRRKSTIAFRLTGEGDVAGQSFTRDIQELGSDIIEEVEKIEGVVDAEYHNIENSVVREDNEVTQSHSELHVVFHTISSVECRNLTDEVLTTLRAIDRAE